MYGWRSGQVVTGAELEHAHGKPMHCPFCGGTRVALWLGPAPHITCGECGADGPAIEGERSDLFERQRRAVNAWNTRSARNE